MTGLRVYKAISAVAGELARHGIPKSNIHLKDLYQYRSIDEVMDRLSPLLAKHRLCVLPRVLDRVSVERSAMGGLPFLSVTLKVSFDIVCAHDASKHTIEVFGEANDDGDKATAKAMSSAYKYAMLQSFCIPVVGIDDADASTLKIAKSDHEPEPVQGWQQWSEDIRVLIAACITIEAVERVQNRYRSLLKSISRERPDLYRSIGDAVLLATSVRANADKPNNSRSEIEIESINSGLNSGHCAAEEAIDG